ncbi:MAG: hypothetical protein CVU09_05015 [Bacteroidetes bacterium HGW-Bacteroidetes-4]|jgi:hypothetical protein|nr:MAG: hypothetical protein CVU09_05015 [Bacteroidetes bacterium HGW-Bacteroidetes-4]
MFIDILNIKTEEKIKVTTDRPLKSIVKTITWRIIGTFDTIFISSILTGKFTLALSIGSIEDFQKIF